MRELLPEDFPVVRSVTQPVERCPMLLQDVRAWEGWIEDMVMTAPVVLQMRFLVSINCSLGKCLCWEYKGDLFCSFKLFYTSMLAISCAS